MILERESEEEVSPLTTNAFEMNEDLKDVASASFLVREARLAYKVSKGLKSKDDCQQIVDYHMGSIGDMVDFFCLMRLSRLGRRKRTMSRQWTSWRRLKMRLMWLRWPNWTDTL